ncbi:MAG TPA: hypothetical protein VGZ02_00845, partial [Candidatus Baltobacteraceae bacterium]|nr:hypothetical protein [Candidatus Baltobacteraceae bacterium]
MKFTSVRAAAAIVASALAACSAPTGSAVSPAAMTHLEAGRVAAGSHSVLYVAEDATNAVYLFDPSNIAAGPTGKITSGIQGPTALAVDPSGDLYVGNVRNVTVYKPGSSTPFKTLASKFGAPRNIVISADDTIAILFGGGVLNSGGLVIFDKGSPTPTRIIPVPLGNNTALTFRGAAIDGTDTLFVSINRYAFGPSGIFAFAPNSTHGAPTGLSAGIIGGFDSAGNLYNGDAGFICRYAPGGKTCAHRITNGLGSYVYFTVAADGTLFVPQQTFNGQTTGGQL